MSENLKIQPFRVHFNVWVECVGFERLEDETEEQARAELIKEVRQGFKQTAYDLEWDIEDGDVEPLNERGETAEEAEMRASVSRPLGVEL